MSTGLAFERILKSRMNISTLKGGNMEQFYKIAGLTVAMDSFGRTVEQAKPYLSERSEPDMIISGNWEKLKESQPHLSVEDCEYLATGGSFYNQLLQFDGMMLHASAVVMDGYAYLFSAPCGTGKSTHTNIWLKIFDGQAYMLNDDKPALRREDGVWYAYGTPWSGKHDISTNVRVPVAGICFLHQAKDNSIKPLTGPKTIVSLLEQTGRPADARLRIKLMELLDQLINEIPIWQMGCNMNPEAAVMSYQAMSGKGKDA